MDILFLTSCIQAYFQCLMFPTSIILLYFPKKKKAFSPSLPFAYIRTSLASGSEKKKGIRFRCLSFLMWARDRSLAPNITLPPRTRVALKIGPIRRGVGGASCSRRNEQSSSRKPNSTRHPRTSRYRSGCGDHAPPCSPSSQSS